ncbi:MAG: hypothetical protein LBG07_02015 [Treponema sp.]|nr:hypothetical protein [Treponema sp.]
MIFLLLSCFLYAQDGESPPPVPFPLGPVLVEAFYGDGRWRPDWPVEIAPDAFTVRGEAVLVAVELGNTQGPGAGDSGGREFAGMELAGGESGDMGLPPRESPSSRYRGIPYRLARDSEGRLVAFPMPLDLTGEGPAGRVFVQVEIRHDGGEGIVELRILSPAGEKPAIEKLAGEEPAETGAEEPEALLSWSVLFPGPCLPEMFPVGGAPPGEPVEVRRGDELHYVLFGGARDSIAETWYDPWGNFTAYFETKIGPVGSMGNPGGALRVLGLEGEDHRGHYSYESGGNLSQYSGDQGLFSALYSASGRPLYWAAGRDYGLQWDEGGLLTGMRDLAPPDAVSGEEAAAFRYEYEFDSRGNWIRRREIALFLKENLLLPGYMRETVRQIDYAVGD